MEKVDLAELSPKELEAVRLLEQKLGGICLLAVRKEEAFWSVEAKLGPNEWKPVDKVYPEIERLKSFYIRREDADLAKSTLKNLLRNPNSVRQKKLPIRIRKVA